MSLLKVVAVGALLLACAPGTAAAAVTGHVGTSNMAGNTDRNPPGDTDVGDAVVNSMLDRRPVAMMLQEACYAQFHHTRARLNSLYRGAFFKVPGATCQDGSFGNALLWRRDVLAVNHTKQYHLNSEGGLEKPTRGWATKYPVIVGGDFNTTPREDQLDAMYLPDYGEGASGIFREIDDLDSRDGEFTHAEGKLDHIFFKPALGPAHDPVRVTFRRAASSG
jgi:hypothetical protein